MFHELVKEKELLSLSVNSAGDYASVGLISDSNKYIIHSLGLNPSNSNQRQQIDLQIPSTYDKKAHECPIQWGRHVDTEELLAVGANQKLELWNFVRSVPQPLSLTQGHLLAIRDINWSVNPNLLGSCSYDSSVLIWDTRDNTQPSVRIKTLAGASCIRFSKEREDILALAHEDIVTIWDIRSVNRYLTFLDLPDKVLNLDWHPKVPQVLTTASKDGFIRVWNYEAQQNDPLPLAEKCHKLNGVSRVKFTPCGKGLVSCSTVMTQKSPSISLWRLRGDAGVGKCQVENAGFVGCSNELVVGMEWAQQRDSYRLCTISKSKEMRLYEVDARSFSTYENPEGKALGKKRQPMAAAGPTDMFRGPEGYEPTSLQEEVDYIKKYVSQNERMDFQQMGERRYSVKMRSNDEKNVVQCVIYLPLLYPRACEPNFEIYTSLGLVEVSVKSELIQTLTSIAAHYVSHNRFCLKYCIDTLSSSFQKLSLENSNGSLYQDLNELYTHTKISPPLMGAKFGANDRLVIFGLVRSQVETPRARSHLTQRLTRRDTWIQNISHPNQTNNKGSRYTQESVVKICDLSSLTRLDYELARDSSFYECDPLTVCYHNRLLAATHNRADLVQVWQLLLQLVSVNSEDYSPHLQFMATEVISNALEYYVRVRDVQSVAILACFVSAHNRKVEKKLRLEITDRNLLNQLNVYKTIYSQILYRWDLLNSECKVLKCIDKTHTNKARIKTSLRSECVICHCLAQGLVTACPVCQHGGHVEHMKEWFTTNKDCPTGCGCKCVNGGESLS